VLLTKGIIGCAYVHSSIIVILHCTINQALIVAIQRYHFVALSFWHKKKLTEGFKDTANARALSQSFIITCYIKKNQWAYRLVTDCIIIGKTSAHQSIKKWQRWSTTHFMLNGVPLLLCCTVQVHIIPPVHFLINILNKMNGQT
jgi:hypothetical protein